MATYIVSYDLISIKNYPKLTLELQNHNAVRILDSVWVINSNLTSSMLRDRFRNYVDFDDKLIVFKISSEWASYNISQITDILKFA